MPTRRSRTGWTAGSISPPISSGRCRRNEAAAFLAALEANNSRDWFEANKSTYETVLKRPAAAFADARFSKDKTHDRASASAIPLRG
jgi:uncharacterized protein (DUF2461 family)